MRVFAAVLVLCTVAGPVAYGQSRGDSQRGSTAPERSRIYNRTCRTARVYES